MKTVSSRSFTSLTATILLAGCLCHAASAADATAPDEQTARQDTVDEAVPLIAIEGSSELQMDAGIGNNGTTSFYATVDRKSRSTFPTHFACSAISSSNRSLIRSEGQTNVLRSQRFYAEELYAGLTAAQVKVALGKINPVFGAATDDAPGIYPRLRRQLRLQRRTGTGDKILSHRGHHRERRRCPDGEADNRRPCSRPIRACSAARCLRIVVSSIGRTLASVARSLILLRPLKGWLVCSQYFHKAEQGTLDRDWHAPAAHDGDRD